LGSISLYIFKKSDFCSFLTVDAVDMSNTLPSSSTGTDSPAPSTPDVAVGGATDDMARGLMNFLEPILLETDEQIKNVVSSQNALSNQIDSLQDGMIAFTCYNSTWKSLD
jgi:hypothetical protein